MTAAGAAVICIDTTKISLYCSASSFYRGRLIMLDNILSYWLIIIPILSYPLIITTFGGGLAVDLGILTLSRFQDESLNKLNWAIPLGLTHSLLPALGYYIFWALGKDNPDLQSWLSLFGALLIYLVIYEIIHEEIGKETKVSLSGTLSFLLSLLVPTSKKSTQHFVMLMAVSWDALLCAPTLIPQAGNWDLAQIISAFVVFGLIAGATAFITLKIASRWRKQHFHNVTQLVHYKIRGSFLGLTVLGVFGILALSSAFGIEDNYFYSIISSIVIMFLVFLTNWKLFRNQAYLEAEESINGTSTD